MEKLCMDEVILSYVALQGVDFLTFEVGEGSGGDFEKYILQGYIKKKHSCTLGKPKESVLRPLVTLRINHTN